MSITLIFVIVFAAFGIIGLVLKFIGICIQNITLCYFAHLFECAASGFVIGLGFGAVLGWVHLDTPREREKIDKPAEKVYVNRCWTILGQEYCGKFNYENDSFKMSCDEDGHCDLRIKVNE